MKQSIDVRVRIPLADIVDAMADEVAREVERQVAPFVRGTGTTARISTSTVVSLEDAVDEVVRAVTRLDNNMHNKDEGPAMQALYRAALALRRVRKEQLKKEKLNDRSA